MSRRFDTTCGDDDGFLGMGYWNSSERKSNQEPGGAQP